MKTAVQFGAGNIGRGFLGQLFYESGYEVVFVDVVPEVVAALNANRRYHIRIVGPGASDIPIENVRAVDGRDREAVAAEIARCEIACSAVGAHALKHIAPNLAAGLRQRASAGAPPLNVLVCENLHKAGEALRELVAESLPDHERESILARTGFVQAVVSRMVPLQAPPAPGEDPLRIAVEAYKRLPVDASAVVGVLPAIVGVEPVANFQAHEDRKLFLHNCLHAVLGYLGYLLHIQFGYQALADPRVRRIFDQVLNESFHALLTAHGFDPVEHRAHADDLVTRLGNVALGDTCYRLARDPLRKLAPNDRLVGAARLVERTGGAPESLACVIGAALQFDAEEDPAAVELQRRIRDDGLDATLVSVCGIGHDEPLAERVRAAYRSLPASLTKAQG